MNIQQRRLFFQAATSCKANPRSRRAFSITSFRPCGRIAAILSAALLFGCTSLTPERINVLAAIAGQAAQVGASTWLAKHPENRPAFDAVIAALTALARNGNTNETAFVELMSSLPTSSLRGPDGELYVTEADLVIWDAQLKKAVEVKGPAVEPVMRATLAGLKWATAPKPPALQATGKQPLRALRIVVTNQPVIRAEGAGISPESATNGVLPDALLDQEFTNILKRLPTIRR